MKRASWDVVAALAVVLAVGGCCELGSCKRAQDGGFAVGNEDRLVIYGDSITAGVGLQTYPRYLELYCRCLYPDWKGEAWNRGLSGDHAGNMARYRQQCLPLKPTVVTFNMGMNDACWGADFPKALARYRSSLEAIVAETRTNLPDARLVLCSAIPYEMNADFMLGAKAATLRRFAEVEREVADETGTRYLDVNRAYAEFLGTAEVLNKGVLAFSNDGVHPGVTGGHLMLAVAFIEGLGADPFLASETIDAVAGQVVASKGVTVAKVRKTADGIAFTRRLARSPFPAILELRDQQLRYNDRAIYHRFDLANRLNRDMVKVTGLDAGNYDVLIDDMVYGTFSSEEFARGVNFGAFCDSPDFERACELSDAIGAKQVAQMALMHAELAKKPDADVLSARKTELAAASAEIAKYTHPLARAIELKRTDRPFDAWNRRQEAVDLAPARGMARAGRGFGVTGVLEAREDGRFVGSYTVLVRNYSDQVRRAEVSAPKGFSPVGKKFILQPGEKAELAFDYDLPSDAVVPVVKMRQYRDDLRDVPVVMHLPFALKRKALFTADQAGVRKTRVELMPGSEAALARNIGPADLSGQAVVRHRNGRLSVKVDVQDADHVNGFTNPDRIGWDDSLVVQLDKKSYTLAWTSQGAMFAPTDLLKEVKFSVARDEEKGLTVYSLDLPYVPASDARAVDFGLTVFDRDSSQHGQSVLWAGELLFSR